MQFLIRFEELIKETNTNLSIIAKATGIPRSTLSSYTNRKSTPSAMQLILLANFFAVSIDYLVGREDDFGNVAPSEPALSENEKRLLKAFNSLSDVAQRKLIDDAEFYAGNVTQAIPKAIKK